MICAPRVAGTEKTQLTTGIGDTSKLLETAFCGERGEESDHGRGMIGSGRTWQKRGWSGNIARYSSEV